MHINPATQEQHGFFVYLGVWILILSFACHPGCSSQGSSDDLKSTSSSIDRPEEVDDIDDLLRRMLDDTEPSLGHLSTLELQVASYGVEVLPKMIPWMTSDDYAERYYARRILERVSIVEFGWKSGPNVDWREKEWLDFWKELGGYNADLSAQDSKRAQSLWASYLQDLKQSGETMGVHQP